MYMALTLDLGVTDCQYSKEFLARQPFQSVLLWVAPVPFGEPGSPEQAGATYREQAITSRLSPRGVSAPLARRAPFTRLST